MINTASDELHTVFSGGITTNWRIKQGRIQVGVLKHQRRLLLGWGVQRDIL
jgi:hypothetical protein